MLNIDIFNVNVEVGTLTKISEFPSGETPRASDQMLTLSPLSCPGDFIIIFKPQKTQKHHLMGPWGLTMPRDVLKWASAYISFS